MFRQSASKIKTAVSHQSLVRNCCKDAKKPPLCAHHKELVPPFCEVVKLKNFELKSDCTTFHMKSTGGNPPCPPAPCPPTKAETSPCDPCNNWNKNLIEFSRSSKHRRINFEVLTKKLFCCLFLLWLCVRCHREWINWSNKSIHFELLLFLSTFDWCFSISASKRKNILCLFN